jgi:DNA-binding Lrp family transcriptional regulator
MGRPRKPILDRMVKLARLIWADPSLSNEKLAGIVGISRNDVGKRRRELEEKGFIEPSGSAVRIGARRAIGTANRAKMLEVWEMFDPDFDAALRELEQRGLPHSASYFRKILTDAGFRLERKDQAVPERNRPSVTLHPWRVGDQLVGETILTDRDDRLDYQIARQSDPEYRRRKAMKNSPEYQRMKREEKEEKARQRFARDMKNLQRNTERYEKEKAERELGAQILKHRAIRPARS